VGVKNNDRGWGYYKRRSKIINRVSKRKIGKRIRADEPHGLHFGTSWRWLVSLFLEEKNIAAHYFY
jgi:hypothetical protein